MNSGWEVSAEKYRDLIVRCSPGTHEQCASVIKKYCNLTASVLDIAAGTGAWIARLQDLGFTDLMAIEKDSARFKLDGIQPSPLDLNNDFSDVIGSTFDLVTAIEIIEHLDNPRHFLREIRNVMNQDGYLLITTPNIGHFAGRLRFLLTAEHRLFSREEYDTQHHITPITHLQIQLMFKEIGLKLLSCRTAGSTWGPLKKVLLSPFTALLNKQLMGDVSIYLLQKYDVS